jgi:predicted DNA-binding ribbon-helix-helix protein
MVKVLVAGAAPLTDGDDAALITRYVRIGKQPTTFRLEPATWKLLCGIAGRQNLTVEEVCADIAVITAADADLAAAIRCYVLGDIVQQVPLEQLPAELRELIENPPITQ